MSENYGFVPRWQEVDIRYNDGRGVGRGLRRVGRQVGPHFDGKPSAQQVRDRRNSLVNGLRGYVTDDGANPFEAREEWVRMRRSAADQPSAPQDDPQGNSGSQRNGTERNGTAGQQAKAVTFEEWNRYETDRYIRNHPEYASDIRKHRMGTFSRLELWEEYEFAAIRHGFQPVGAWQDS